MRGGAAKDENLKLMARFSDAYHRVAKRYSKRLVYIENNGDIENAYQAMVTVIENVFDANQAERSGLD
jgi:thymidylate kinase